MEEYTVIVSRVKNVEVLCWAETPEEAKDKVALAWETNTLYETEGVEPVTDQLTGELVFEVFSNEKLETISVEGDEEENED